MITDKMTSTLVENKRNQQLLHHFLRHTSTGSWLSLHRRNLNTKALARIQRQRDFALDERRKNVAPFPSSQEAIRPVEGPIFDLDWEIQVQEQLDGEAFQAYEDWLQQELEKVTAEEDESVVCPVCCRQWLEFNTEEIVCRECQISWRAGKSATNLRHHINGFLADHNITCAQQPQFTHVPDNEGPRFKQAVNARFQRD